MYNIYRFLFFYLWQPLYNVLVLVCTWKQWFALGYYNLKLPEYFITVSERVCNHNNILQPIIILFQTFTDMHRPTSKHHQISYIIQGTITLISDERWSGGIEIRMNFSLSALASHLNSVRLLTALTHSDWLYD